jgi:hypothetical protein
MRAATSKRRELVHPDDAALPPEQQTVFVVERIPPTVVALLNDRCTELVHDIGDDRTVRSRAIKTSVNRLVVETAAAALVEIRNLLDDAGRPIAVPTAVHPDVGAPRVAREALERMLDLDVLTWLVRAIRAEESEREAETGEPSSQPISRTTTS